MVNISIDEKYIVSQAGTSEGTQVKYYMNEYGKNLADDILQFDTIDERIQYVIRFVKECCNIDITSYLGKVFTLDSVVLNEDRHFNNLALILVYQLKEL